MPDIATIATLISSIKSATDIAKLISDSGVTLEKAEIKLKIAELVSALADAKMEIADIQSLILEKDAQIVELQRALDEKVTLTFDGKIYWSGEGDSREGPFCQRCYDAERKLIRLQYHHGARATWYHCTACGTDYEL